MTDLIGIGASGLSAYQSALSTVSDNVVNAQTKGYARRSTDIVESPTASGILPYYRSTTTNGGVQAAGITRAWDDFSASESRVASSDASNADARMRWLTAAQTAMDSSDSGAGAKVTAFYTAADALAANPGGDLPRRAMLSALDDAAGAIRTSADALSRTATGIATEAGTTVASLNANLNSLAAVNQSLVRAGSGTEAAASLADQRDQLIDTISTQVGVTVSLEPNGAADLTLAGSDTKLLSGVTASQFSLQQANDGRLSLTASPPSGGGVAANPTSGALAGLVDAASTVATRRLQLNGIAVDFAATVNGWQANGTDANGNAGAPLLTISGGADTLQVATTDPSTIAAASSDGTANGNLIALQSLRDGPNGAEQRIASMVAAQSQMVSSATSEATATATRRDDAFAARDNVAGVDLDKEAADLLRFQQAYQGSAKIVQTARDTLQSILDLF